MKSLLFYLFIGIAFLFSLAATEEAHRDLRATEQAADRLGVILPTKNLPNESCPNISCRVIGLLKRMQSIGEMK